MHFDIDARTASLSVGEFAGFTLGPRDATGGASGLWRAQLGTQWHRQLRERVASEHTDASFEVMIEGRIFHRGWTLSLAGRIDQLVPTPAGLTLREIKTVVRPLPTDEAELRAEHPDYFIQLATYAALHRIATHSAPQPKPETRNRESGIAAPAPLRTELVFVEVSGGLSQTVALTAADDALFRAQLERVVEFLSLRQRARERLRRLRVRPPFSAFRPGQEQALASLQAVLGHQQTAILFEAPTGFGKTGILLEAALAHLRAGHFERVIYLTSKATGQIQVMRTLQAMCAPAEEKAQNSDTSALAVWLTRPKSEHCVNHAFHCVRETCAYLADMAVRWPRSGLARFYLNENEPRDLESLRTAGREALVCPYEITRAALGFNDVWIGDYNYVFAPANRGLFFDQPGFDPARTLLVIDEAHNLPARVADAYSHVFASSDAEAALSALHRVRANPQLATAWDHWAHFLRHLAQRDSLALADEDDARHLIEQVARLVATLPLDYAGIGPEASERLWRMNMLTDQLETGATLARHWWAPRNGELAVTCIDAAPAIGVALREFGGVMLASATFGPEATFAESLGLSAPIEPEPLPAENPPERLGKLTKRDTRRLFRQVTSGAALLHAEEARAAAVTCLRAETPWRDGAYDVARDVRVDTTFQHRARHHATTAATAVALRSAMESPIAVFFPSYAYAEAILHEIEAQGAHLRVALQQRLTDLAAQTAWVESSLSQADALFLVLGSSFAESIDLLGGRIGRAMVVGPALPEVNAVQHARMAALASLGREAAFRRVYQIPGMQKVNQALGRLVRAPGQRAKVLLHCRRFAEPGYVELLAPDYRSERTIATDADLAAWLQDDMRDGCR